MASSSDAFTTYNFHELFDLLPSFMIAKLPILLRGSTGIGKTDVVFQLARAKGLDVIEVYASQCTEGDLTGLPDPNGTISDHDFLLRAAPTTPPGFGVHP